MHFLVFQKYFFKEKNLSQFPHVYSHMLLKRYFFEKQAAIAFFLNNLRDVKKDQKLDIGTILTFNIFKTM